MYCAKCGIEFLESAKFCQQCGNAADARERGPIAAASPVSSAQNNVEPDAKDLDYKNDPTISALLNSLADGSFKKSYSHPSSKRLVLALAVILGVIAATVSGGCWYWKYRMPSHVDRQLIIEKVVENPVNLKPFVIEKSPDEPAGTYPPVKNVSKKKERKKSNVTSAHKIVQPREERSSADSFPDKRAEKTPNAPQKGSGSLLNRSFEGPHVTPPSRDPRETGF
jgi:hypothetical protein